MRQMTSDDISDICKKTVVIVAPTRQEYVYHELENRVSVFSHVKENFMVNCGDVTLQHCLGKGLNSVLLPVGCEASTSELRIMAPSVGADDTTLKPLIHELDIIDEIGELGKDLVALHGINVSMLSDELSEYMRALKVEELDIDKVSVTLENMRHLSDIKEYSVTKLSLKEIGSVSSTVSTHSVLASKASMDTVSVGLDDIERVLEWSVRYERDKVMIHAVLDGLELYFNPYSGKVEDASGRRHLVSRPDVNILTDR